MKKLEDNVLLYDAECPMCNVYSQGFIAAGMLDKNGRQDYCEMTKDIRGLVDTNRARNEIALVNIKTNTTLYGIESLFAIIGNSFPILNRLFDFHPFKYLMKRVYSFVSYNRRVIICGSNPQSPLACRPDFSLKYRIAYLLFASFLSAAILRQFSPLLQQWWPIPQGWLSEIILVLGQLLFQGLVLLLFAKERHAVKAVDYLGNLITVSLLGSLLLLPIVLISKWITIPLYLSLPYFGAAVLLMFLEHKRRVKAHNLPGYLSYTWILYRMIAVGTSLLLTATLNAEL